MDSPGCSVVKNLPIVQETQVQFLGQEDPLEEGMETERVIGRKARGLQMEEIACKCKTFLSLLSGRKKQTRDFFSFFIQISKFSLKMLCFHDTWFHLKLTILKP